MAFPPNPMMGGDAPMMDDAPETAGDGGHTHPSLEARITAIEKQLGIGQPDSPAEDDSDLDSYVKPMSSSPMAKKGPLFGR